MGSVEYDTARYLDELDASNEHEDLEIVECICGAEVERRDLVEIWEPGKGFSMVCGECAAEERYLFDKTLCTEPAVRMVHEASLCVAMMNQIRWGIKTHSIIPEITTKEQ